MADLSVSKPLQAVSTFLDNYWNRDQVFRTLQYASILCSGALEPRLPVASTRFSALASAISSTRMTLRLLDDIPNLARTLAGWKRPKGSSNVLNIAELLSSLSGLLYYPTEHLAWATDLKILPLSSPSLLWNFCTALWITSLSTSCLRSLFTLQQTRQEITALRIKNPRSSKTEAAHTAVSTSTATSRPKGGGGSAGDGRKRVTFQNQSGGPGGNNSTRLRVLRGLYIRAVLSLVQSLSDMVIAVHYLPHGVLWGGRLSTLLVGLFGTLSSLLGLYKILPCRTV